MKDKNYKKTLLLESMITIFSILIIFSLGFYLESLRLFTYLAAVLSILMLWFGISCVIKKNKMKRGFLFIIIGSILFILSTINKEASMPTINHYEIEKVGIF